MIIKIIDIEDRFPVEIFFEAKSNGEYHNKTTRLKEAGYDVISGPRTTGDGYYESCIVGIEGNQIEITE